MSRGFRRRCSTLSNPTLLLEVKKKEIGNRPALPESVQCLHDQYFIFPKIVVISLRFIFLFCSLFFSFCISNEIYSKPVWLLDNHIYLLAYGVYLDYHFVSSNDKIYVRMLLKYNECFYLRSQVCILLACNCYFLFRFLNQINRTEARFSKFTTGSSYTECLKDFDAASISVFSRVVPKINKRCIETAKTPNVEIEFS